MVKIRFGIIGCGFIAKRMANALMQSDDACLVGVAARDYERACDFAKLYPDIIAYESYDELISSDDIDCVYIATVHTTHAEIALKCIKNKKPVLCEKPFFISGEDALTVSEAAKRENVLIMEGMWTRFLPCVNKAKKWISDGEIGELKCIIAPFCFNYPFNENTRNKRHFNPDLGGGVWLDAGVYPYEYISFIAGSQPTEVVGMNRIGETGVDVTTSVLMRFADQTIGIALASMESIGCCDAQIYGNKGSIVQYDFIRSRKVALFKDGILIEMYEDPIEEGFLYEISHFSTLVRDQKNESDVVPVTDSIDFAVNTDRLLK